MKYLEKRNTWQITAYEWWSQKLNKNPQNDIFGSFIDNYFKSTFLPFCSEEENKFYKWGIWTESDCELLHLCWNTKEETDFLLETLLPL